jgi:hypothetical protein
MGFSKSPSIMKFQGVSENGVHLEGRGALPMKKN